jgi:uncharacterized repeat protein (TIGR03803 family)
MILVAVIPAAHAQTYTVLHNFTSGEDGSLPRSTLTMDRAGNLYGTAGNTVFRMIHRGEGWLFNPLYNSPGGAYGNDYNSAVTIGPDGNLYGTTSAGGYSGGLCVEFGCGIVYRLRPPAASSPAVFPPWSETVLHAFLGEPADGNSPMYGALAFDPAGNLYGTTQSGGSANWGTVFELTPTNGAWRETTLLNFSYQEGSNGQAPQSGVIIDQAGNLYGTTVEGGEGVGVVYELSPTPNGWVETVLHSFAAGNDGDSPYGGVIMDQAGNLYGATYTGGTGHGGVVYELSPGNAGWTYQILYNLSGPPIGGGPFATLTLDAAGNLYGTTNSDGANDAGMVFKLTNSHGVWNLTDLHDFDFDTAYFPYGGVTLDANGNLYGTTEFGGDHGDGVVWQIVP